MIGLQWGHGLAAVDGRSWRPARRGPCRASMGPRPCGRGRPHQARGVGRPRRASMGPRPCGRGRRGPDAPSRRMAWASMGPRPCGRGRPGDPTGGGRPRERFNGATALRPWTARPSRPARATRLGFNGATALRPWTAPEPVSHQVLNQVRFNGATALRPWTARYVDRRDGASVASMGPRPCGRGRTCLARARRRTTRCFNGATALRPWTDRRKRPSSSCGTRGFNGATALRPWTACRRAGCPRRLPCPCASMGPRPCGRGRLAGSCTDRVQADLVRRFNGATALRPWTARLGQTDVQFWVDRCRMHCQHHLFASYSFRPAAFVMPAL